MHNLAPGNETHYHHSLKIVTLSNLFTACRFGFWFWLSEGFGLIAGARTYG